MNRIVFGPWTIQPDTEATKLCYEQTEEVPPEGCGCDPCRNFALVREQAYPPAVIALFKELGIDPWKPLSFPITTSCLRDCTFTAVGITSAA